MKVFQLFLLLVFVATLEACPWWKMSCGGYCCPVSKSCCNKDQELCCESCSGQVLCNTGDIVLGSAAVDNLNRTFAFIDANHDGKLTLREGLDLFKRQNGGDEAFPVDDFLGSDVSPHEFTYFRCARQRLRIS